MPEFFIRSAHARTALGRGPSTLFMTAGVIVTGLMLTVTSVQWRQRDIRLDAEAKFQRHVALVEAEIQRRFTLPGYGLKGARGIYVANASVGRSAFRSYVESRNLPREFPGVRGFGFAQRVMRQDLDRFVSAERLDEAPDFAVRSSGAARDLYVIKFIEPLGDNFPAWGFDLGSEPVRRLAIDRAIQSGEPVLSDPVTLLQDGRQGPGFLYLLPVYRNGTDPGNFSQREDALLGLLYAPIVVAEILAGAVDASSSELDFELFDGAEPKAEKRVFSTRDSAMSATALLAGQAAAAGLFVATRSMPIGGRLLTLRAGATTQFAAAQDQVTPMLVALGGTLLSGLLALTVWLLGTGRARAVKLAKDMTGDLDRLAEVVRHTSSVVVITDREFRIVWINDGFTKTYGYTLGEAAGRKPDDLLRSGKTPAGNLASLAEAIRSGISCRTEVLNLDKSGRQYWIALELQPRRDAAGALTGFMEVGSDITQRKRAESLLRATNASLDRAEKISGVGGWEVDLRAGTLAWSNQTCRIHDLEPGHQPLLDEGTGFFAPTERDIIARTARACIQGGEPWDLQLPMVTSKGRSVWIRSIGAVETQNGRAVRLVGTLQDVTAQRALQEELRRSNTVLEVILDNLPCGLSVFDSNLTLVAHNTQFRRLIDLPDSLFAGPVTRFEDIIRYNALRGEYGVGDTEEIVARTVERAAHPVAHQFERQRHDGTSIEIRGAPMPGGGFVSTYMDISERKKIERLKGEFISTISHELRTPLTSIHGSLSLLASGAAGELPVDIKTLVEIAHQSSERLIRLINDVLDVEKIASGMMSYTMTRQPLAPLVDQAVAAMRPFAARYEVALAFDTRIEHALVEADADRIIQVLVNLLSNAAKFSGRAATVSVQMASIGDCVRVSVVDRGQGISDEFRGRIFERFSQADGSDQRQRGGTGLGLNICKSIIEAHRGRLDYTSTPGRGSVFFFDLPLSVAHAG